MKEKRRKIGFLRVLLAIFTVVFLFVTPPLLLPSLSADPAMPFYLPSPQPWQGVIDIWHVDMWPGGRNSRPDWLKARAAEFEKRYNSVFFDVKSLTPEQAIQFLSEYSADALPDVISFSQGLLEQPQNFLEQLPQINSAPLRKGLDKAGYFDDKRYAMPYMIGGYAMLSPESVNADNLPALLSALYKAANNSKGKKTAIVWANSDYNSPAAALAYAKAGQITKPNPLAGTATYEQAWQSFGSGETVGLCGSQREVCRAVSAINRALLSPVSFLPVAGSGAVYTDLVQYISVRKGLPESQREICAKFIEYLLSDRVQASLVNIGMFTSIAVTPGMYKDEPPMDALSLALSRELAVPYAFCSKQSISDLTAAANKYLKEGDSSLLKSAFGAVGVKYP